MENYLTKDEVKVILNNAPKNLDRTKIVESLVKQGYTLEGFSESQQKNLGNRIVSAVKERGQNVVNEIQSTQNPILKGVKATAQGFGAVADVGEEVLRTIPGGDTILDNVGSFIGKGFNKVTDKLSETPIIKGAAAYDGKIAGEDALEVASSLGEIAGTIAGVGGVSTASNTAARVAKKSGKKVVENTNDILKSITERSDDQIRASVFENYAKAVKPTVAGKNSLSKDIKYKTNVIDAVKTIKNNANDITYIDDVGERITGTPKTPQQFAEAVDQTKKKIFNQYDTLAKDAGDMGVSVDMTPIASELDTVIGNKSLAITNPRAIEYAEKLKDRLSTVGNIDAQTAQDVIQNYNKSLEAFYRNPSYDNASQAAIDALVANKFRESLDTGITGLTGQQYSALKKQYGALKSIENDVVKSAFREARKNTKGLIDYTDIFSGGQVVNGILSLDPASIASGLAQKGISSFYKYLNSPNRAIQKLFKDIENLK